MPSRIAVIVLLGVGAAAIALLRPTPLGKEEQTELVPLVVAATDIGRFVNLAQDHLKVKYLPKYVVPEGAIRNVEDVFGRSVMVPMVKGEPVLQKKLSEKGFGQVVIPEGLRAVTVPITNAAPFVLPGGRVDLTLTISSPTGGTESFVLLEDVEVLAFQRQVGDPGGDESLFVTLGVTIEQAKKLSLAQAKGKLGIRPRD